MKRTIVIVVAALVMLSGVWLAYYFGGFAWLGYAPKPGAGDSADGTTAGGASAHRASDSASREVAAIGRLEPAGGIISIGEGLVDRLESLFVEEGSTVAKGKPLAKLESHALRELELASYDAQIKEAEARRSAEENLAEARIESARLALKRAESRDIDENAQEKQVALYAANLALEKKNLARLENLSIELVSTQERERQALLVQKAAAELTAAEATLTRMKQTGEFTMAAAQGDLDAAVASKSQVTSAIPVESLKKARDVASINLARSTVIAPSKGTVLKIHSRPGEVLGRKPILQMADLDKMVCVAEVYETDVQKLTVGQSAEIHTTALGDEVAKKPLEGTIFRIGQLIATPEMKSLDPFARADRHVVEVIIMLDQRSTKLAAGLVNLQVDVKFPKGRDGGPRQTTSE